MDHFGSYTAAGNACLAVQEQMEANAERIEARAEEIANRMLDNPELWADALADFAYWPAESAVYRKEPQPELAHGDGPVPIRPGCAVACGGANGPR